MLSVSLNLAGTLDVLADRSRALASMDSALLREEHVVGIPTKKTPERFAASDISSVIALAKPENGGKRTKKNERIRKG